MKKKVLIVDDEAGIIEVIQDYIEHSGIGLQVISANSVDDALLLVESEKPDVIISDIAMPIKNGLDFLRELVARQKRIPVIIVSGYGDKEMISRAWKLGAFDFLDKPINSKRLLENLKIAMESGEEILGANAVAPQSVKVMLDAQVLENATKAAAAVKLSLDKWIIELIKKTAP